MKRMFKGLWYMIWDIVGIILTSLIMAPIYVLDILGEELVMRANEIMWDICKRSILSMIVDIVLTAIGTIVGIVCFIVLTPVLIVRCTIEATQHASKYASGEHEKYHYVWRYLWNVMQDNNLSVKNTNENKKYSGFRFKSYSDK